jgi:peptidoglycan glycosyltransferase
MKQLLRRGRVARVFAAAVLLVSGACTADDPEGENQTLPSAAVAAAQFLTAWSDGNYVTMEEGLGDDSAALWTPARLEKWMERKLDGGSIESIHASLAEEPSVSGEGTAATATATYSIAYDSGIVPSTTSLYGELAMSFEPEGQRWLIDWGKPNLWPGVDGATSFELVRRWPRRAAILDREGRVLARGAADARRYPYGNLAGSTIGHIEPASAAELRPGYVRGDLVGGSGMEAAFEDRLAGRPAAKLRIVGSSGGTLEVAGEVDEKLGRPVRTTLDIDIQRGAQSAYGGTTGGAVVLDPRTGDLLAVVDSGAFDPGNYVGVPGIESFNRALEGLYPPGSAMKVVTASAALDTGTVTPATTVTGPKEYQGVRNFESGEFGTIDFATALKYSVNTAFAQVAEDLGARKLTRYAEAFGFNRAPALPLDAAESSFPFPADLGDLMWGSIGQAQVVATPMEMATVAATIANRGRRMEPRVTFNDEPSGRRAVSRSTAQTMTQLMENVVIGGTGSAARIAGVRVAGKTGTAEVDVAGERKNHAWFVAFAPVEDPQVAVAVVSEYGGVGGQVAAPLAGRILIQVLPFVQ